MHLRELHVRLSSLIYTRLLPLAELFIDLSYAWIAFL